jgi:hypothetical protein
MSVKLKKLRKLLLEAMFLKFYQIVQRHGAETITLRGHMC